MQKLLIPAAVLALSLGSAAASAQTYQSTTVQSSPDQVTRTTTTSDDDGYGNYKRTVTTTRSYEAAPYEAPAGYTFTRYAVGEYVPAGLIDDGALTVADYADYQLDQPPPGLVWIRDGNDALLVDGSNGRVIETDYNLFED